MGLVFFIYDPDDAEADRCVHEHRMRTRVPVACYALVRDERIATTLLPYGVEYPCALHRTPSGIDVYHGAALGPFLREALTPPETVSTGPAGPAGPAGLTGPAGPAGLAGLAGPAAPYIRGILRPGPDIQSRANSIKQERERESGITEAKGEDR